MAKYNTVIELAKDVKQKINLYNTASPLVKKEAYEDLKVFIRNIVSDPENRSMIYRGENEAVVFTRTLGQWRMKIWKEIIRNETED